MGTGFQCPELERAELHSLQADHAVPDLLEHPLDLALAALAQRQFDRVGLQHAGLRGSGPSVLELEPLAEQLQCPLAHRWVADVAT